jgi:hypothetical protein
MTRSIIAALALAGVVGCGAQKGDGSQSTQAVKATLPTDKVEVVDGWLRLKQAKAGDPKGMGVMEGANGYLVLGVPISFSVPSADFRANLAADYIEVRLGAVATPDKPPSVGGPAIFDPSIGSPRAAAACGGKPTACIAGWHGCGPMVCSGSNQIVGGCCGGWSETEAPQ